jgi:putative nucleotidyltransferase with HDIG domain
VTLTRQAVDQYLPIAVETLSGGEQADFDLFFRGKGEKPLLFRSRAVPLAHDKLEHLIRSGVKTLLINSADQAAYEEHLRARLDAGGHLLPGVRYALMIGSTRSVFESALRGDNLPGMVGAAEQFGDQLADLLGDGQSVLHEMFDLMLHDYSTFTHSANVATYAAGVAKVLGVSDRSDLSRLAAGALLHDVGKRKIPRRVLNRPGKLTAAEREVIQRHPQIGFEELSIAPDLSWSQLMIVYQHHERLDGRGYPVGIVADEIDPWAKICAVADVFDALTSDRPYHKAISAAAACEFLEQRAGSSFDQETVRCLTTMMQPA